MNDTYINREMEKKTMSLSLDDNSKVHIKWGNQHILSLNLPLTTLLGRVKSLFSIDPRLKESNISSEMHVQQIIQWLFTILRA